MSLRIRNHKLVTVCCRFLWRRFQARKGDGYEGVLQRDESSDPLAVKSLSASGNLLTDEVSAHDNIKVDDTSLDLQTIRAVTCCSYLEREKQESSFLVSVKSVTENSEALFN